MSECTKMTRGKGGGKRTKFGDDDRNVLCWHGIVHQVQQSCIQPHPTESLKTVTFTSNMSSAGAKCFDKRRSVW